MNAKVLDHRVETRTIPKGWKKAKNGDIYRWISLLLPCHKEHWPLPDKKRNVRLILQRHKAVKRATKECKACDGTWYLTADGNGYNFTFTWQLIRGTNNPLADAQRTLEDMKAQEQERRQQEQKDREAVERMRGTAKEARKAALLARMTNRTAQGRRVRKEE